MCLCHAPVLDDQQNVRPIKELLQMLYISLCTLVQDMGKSVLVGNINIWVHRMENIMQWQQQLDNIQINRVNTPTQTASKTMSTKRQIKSIFWEVFIILLFPPFSLQLLA